MAYWNWTKEDAQKFGDTFLEDMMRYISENFKPGGIFDDETLKKSVQGIRGISPEDIFDPADLEAWALSNDFIGQGVGTWMNGTSSSWNS